MSSILPTLSLASASEAVGSASSITDSGYAVPTTAGLTSALASASALTAAFTNVPDSCSGNATVTDDADAASVASCITYTGTLNVYPSVSQAWNPLTISFPGLQEVDGGIVIAGLSDGDATVEFPQLTNVSGPVFAGEISSLRVPSLGQTGGLNLVGNNQYFQDFVAPELELVASALRVADNPSLTAISFPALQTVSRFMGISGHDHLNSIEGFPVLSTVGWYVELNGTFSSADLPSLKSVDGYIRINTTSSNTSICDSFNTLKQNYKAITGIVNCTVLGTKASTDDGPNNDNPSSSTSTSSSSSLSAGAIAGIAIGVLLLALIIFCIWFFRRRRQRQHYHKQKQSQDSSLTDPRPNHHQLPLGGHHEKSELAGSGVGDPAGGKNGQGGGGGGGRHLQELSSHDETRRKSELLGDHARNGEGDLTTSASTSDATTRVDTASQFGGPSPPVKLGPTVSGPLELPGYDWVPELEAREAGGKGRGGGT